MNSEVKRPKGLIFRERIENETSCVRHGIELEKVFIEYLKGLYVDWRRVALPKEMREHLRSQFPSCVYCGSEYELTTEHLDPLELGGEESYRNAVLACKPCNSEKADRPLCEWLRTLPSGVRALLRELYEERTGRPPELFKPGAPTKRSKQVSMQFIYLARGGTFIPGEKWVEVPRKNEDNLVLKISVDPPDKNKTKI